MGVHSRPLIDLASLDLSAVNMSKLTREEKMDLLELVQEHERRTRYGKFFTMYPETGKLSRHNYPKQMEFFAAGKEHRERCMIAGNRTGKTEGTGAYEAVCHLTGKYPDWWPGRKFDDPVRMLIAGDTIASTRDILQMKMMGQRGDFGTGMIPADDIVTFATRGAVPGALDYVRVRHAPSGHESNLLFRSYDQGREIFQGFELDVVWLDEECPEDVYDESLVRTMTTNGMVMTTFTPLNGLTPIVLRFLPGGKLTSAAKTT